MQDYMDIHPKDGRPMTSNADTPNAIAQQKEYRVFQNDVGHWFAYFGDQKIGSALNPDIAFRYAAEHANQTSH